MSTGGSTNYFTGTFRNRCEVGKRPCYCYNPSHTKNHNIYLKAHVNEAVRLLGMREGVEVRQGGQRGIWVRRMVLPVAEVEEVAIQA